jgi:hypothetical protein
LLALRRVSFRSNIAVLRRRSATGPINTDDIIKVTIGLAEPMREGDMIKCHLRIQMSGRIYIVVQRVRGHYKAIPI